MTERTCCDGLCQQGRDCPRHDNLPCERGDLAKALVATLISACIGTGLVLGVRQWLS